MRSTTGWIAIVALAAWGVYAQNTGQTQASVRRTPIEGKSGRTMKTISRGTDYAVSSLMPQATLAAEHMIRAGGNAFDAIVAGEAVLGVVQPAANVLGSDAVLLLYDAKTAKVYSINAEGTAPKLATIEWYAEAFLLLRLTFPGRTRDQGGSASAMAFGRNDPRDTFVALYNDDRGVSRVFGMTFAEDEWRHIAEDVLYVPSDT